MDPHALFDAASAAPPPSSVDLGGLIATQTRVMRRRRYAAGTGVAGLAVAVAGVSAAPSVLFGGDGRSATVAVPVTGVDCADVTPEPTPSVGPTYKFIGVEDARTDDPLQETVAGARDAIAAERRQPDPADGVSTGLTFTSAGRLYDLGVNALFIPRGAAAETADRIACSERPSLTSLSIIPAPGEARRERRSLPGGVEAVVYPDGIKYSTAVDVLSPDGTHLQLRVDPNRDSKPWDTTWTEPTSPASDNPFTTEDLLRAAQAILAP